MRVTGGRFAGRHLKMPKGPAIRPTLDHVRQAIFNLVGERVQGAGVLDLFSGTGALGIEAFSRGAAQVTFVDRSYFCAQAIEANLRTLSLLTPRLLPSSSPGGQANSQLLTLIRLDALAAIRRLHRQGATFDLVFLDPPYGHGLVRKSLNALAQHAIISPSGIVVVEQEKRDPLPPRIEGKEIRLILQRRQRYGDTALAFYILWQTE